MVSEKHKTYLVFVGAIVVVLAYGVLVTPHKHSVNEKISYVIHDVSQGSGKAMRQLEGHALDQKSEDAVKNTNDKVKENTSP